MTEEKQSNAGRVLLGVVAGGVIAVAIFAFMPPRQSAIVPVAPSVPVADVAPEISAPQIDAAAPLPSVIAEPIEEAPKPPVFDTFRVETDGTMVVAGRAEPGQVVDILLSGEVIERVTADGSGSFVAFPSAGFSASPRTLSLLADPDGAATSSETSYIVAPIAEPQVRVAAAPTSVAEPAPLQSASVDLDDPTTESSPPVAAVPDLGAAEVPKIAPALPPVVLQADADGIRVAQSAPAATAPDQDPNIALDAITYDPEGDVQLSGRATSDGAVQVYLNNKPVTASPVTEGGDWQIKLADIDTGVYTLRIDEVDTEGAVVSRLETPFKREVASDVAAVLAEELNQDGVDVAVKTVQPGATLWAIAEENLGNGVFFVEVFEANADLIKDPDLIYPGQIFRIPEITQ